ncbi:histidine phosphotransferase family protein [Roseovarius tolerans]|uniref:histidine phosphotransferase family protein n=1 Tax=Roseovarius tolerans TaxID=74031 RepID=UPI001C312767|nr:histidine phosphotransferase family protein [Roseovarius tolerans]
MQDDPALSALIGSRICHDLASPLGAIANGLELLSLSGLGKSAELTLIQDSLRGAVATLDLSRLAFGRAEPGEMLDAQNLHGTLAAYYANRPRMALDWQVTGPLSRLHAQIIVLLCLGVERALPRGGQLRATGAHPRIEVSALGDTLTPDLALWEGVKSGKALPAPDPRTAQFNMLHYCLAVQGLTLDHRLTDGAFTVSV